MQMVRGNREEGRRWGKEGQHKEENEISRLKGSRQVASGPSGVTPN